LGDQNLELNECNLEDEDEEYEEELGK